MRRPMLATAPSSARTTFMPFAAMIRDVKLGAQYLVVCITRAAVDDGEQVEWEGCRA